MNRPFWSLRTSASLDNCETIEPLLSLAADGLASPEETRRLDAHLPGCESCRAALSWMQATRTALASRPVAVPPPDLHSRIALAIALSSRPVAAPPPNLHARIALAIAASAPAPVSLRPAGVFSLRTAYAAAASLTALGIALSYPLWHATGEVAVHPSSKPVAVASLPTVRTPAVPKSLKPSRVASNTSKAVVINHTVIARKRVLAAVTQTEHIASREVPTKLPATPPVAITPVRHTPLSSQVASHDIALTEKHSIEKHSPLPPLKTVKLKLPEGAQVAKVIKAPLRLDLPAPKITSDTIVVRTASTHDADPSKPDYGMGELRAHLRVQNATFTSIPITKQELSRGAASMMQTVSSNDHIPVIGGVYSPR